MIIKPHPQSRLPFPSASGYEENKPDFSANEYDALRYYFRCDLLEFRRRLEAADVDQQFIDWKSMDRWIA